MNHLKPFTAPRLSRGSTLIEVLVAILVLSIGMLGIAGLQGATLRFSQGGWARAAIGSHLSDLADRVRSNPSGSTTAYLLETDYADQRDDDLEELKDALTDCEAETCGADDLAKFQLIQWRIALNRDMPGGAGFVSGSRDTGYVATVLWYDKDSEEETDTCKAEYEGARARTCCPEAAEVEETAGIRCTNMMVIP